LDLCCADGDGDDDAACCGTGDVVLLMLRALWCYCVVLCAACCGTLIVASIDDAACWY
jgi:hypothetical protein